MTRFKRFRRAIAMFFWRLMNPLALRFGAGRASWWVILETTGRRTGTPRHTPLARGPIEDGSLWLVAVHGRHSHWVKNLIAHPEVRVKHRGSWSPGRAAVEPVDPERLARFSHYARTGPRTLGIDPVLVRVDLERR